jgi:hypothetical protein
VIVVVAAAMKTAATTAEARMTITAAMALVTIPLVALAIAVVLASAVATAVLNAAAATTIAQCHCPQRSHCSGCCHHPPLQHRNQMAMAWAMATERVVPMEITFMDNGGKYNSYYVNL